MGLTIAFGIQPALTVVGQHFKERRALAMGVVSTGSALGGIGFPLMFEQLLPRIGFANAIRLAALKIGYETSAMLRARLTIVVSATRLRYLFQQASQVTKKARGAAHLSSTSEAFWISATLSSALVHSSPSLACGCPHTTSVT